MADALDIASNEIQALKTSLRQFKTQLSSSAPNKQQHVLRIRTQIGDNEKKLTKVIASEPNTTSSDWTSLKREQKQLHDEFVKLDRVFQQTLNASSASSQQANTAPVTQQQLEQAQVRKYNTAGLETEQEYQRQRLKGIQEIEQSVNETRGMFQDFNTMVQAAQPQLNQIEQNVETSTKHVVKGTDEIRKARKL